MKENTNTNKPEDMLGIDSLMKIFRESAQNPELSTEDKEKMLIMEDLLDDMFIDIESDPAQAKGQVGNMIQKLMDTFEIEDEPND